MAHDNACGNWVSTRYHAHARACTHAHAHTQSNAHGHAHTHRPNSEGPLPWIERDYTPISSAKEWESGRCDILIKIYKDGAATSWLRNVTTGSHVWLSHPVKTLSVPSLVATGDAFPPASVLLLLGGTGVVALPQILHHRNPNYKLGFPTHKRDQLQVPIDVVLSCREDDVLLLGEIAQWCAEGETKGVRNFTLLLTSANSEAPIFSDGPNCLEAESKLKGLDNARVLRSRLSPSIVADSIVRMPRRLDDSDPPPLPFCTTTSPCRLFHHREMCCVGRHSCTHAAIIHSICTNPLPSSRTSCWRAGAVWLCRGRVSSTLQHAACSPTSSRTTISQCYPLKPARPHLTDQITRKKLLRPR